jgi:hypothetical protein
LVVERAWAEELTVTVHWSKLGSEPLAIAIRDIHIVLSLRNAAQEGSGDSNIKAGGEVQVTPQDEGASVHLSRPDSTAHGFRAEYGPGDDGADVEEGATWVLASALNSVDVELANLVVKIMRERDELELSLEMLTAKSVPIEKPPQVGEWICKVASLRDVSLKVCCTAEGGSSAMETRVLQTKSLQLEALLPLLGPSTADVRVQLSTEPLVATGGSAVLASALRLLGISGGPTALEPAAEEMQDRYAVVLARLLEQVESLEKENDDMRTTIAALTAAFERQTAVIELLTDENAALLVDLS